MSATAAVGMAVGTKWVIGVLIGTTILGVGATVWATKRSEKMTRASLSEAQKSRELANTQIKTQKEMFNVNTIIGIIGIVVSVAGLIFAAYRYSKR